MPKNLINSNQDTKESNQVIKNNKLFNNKTNSTNIQKKGRNVNKLFRYIILSSSQSK